jgi:tRNA (cmo5U34)-methyltransferase
MSNIDNVNPQNKWEFNEEVTNCFENMLSRSIPQYEVMRELTKKIIDYKINNENLDKFNLLDICCSNGLSLRDIVNKYKARGNYLGIDISEPMLEKANELFKNEINDGYVSIQNIDLRNNFPINNYDIITSILGILFIPIQYRQNIIQHIYDNLKDNGIFIMIEKVIGNSADLDNMMVDIYYDMKANNGYTKEQIERKKLSLEGVQVPVTSNWNIDLLKQAGFRKVDVFWRWMNFEGYIAIK